jgi:hypothetical protein
MSELRGELSSSLLKPLLVVGNLVGLLQLPGFDCLFMSFFSGFVRSFLSFFLLLGQIGKHLGILRGSLGQLLLLGLDSVFCGLSIFFELSLGSFLLFLQSLHSLLSGLDS